MTQANIHQTICIPGYARQVRPPASYTQALKKRQIVEYGYPNPDPALYEEDHLIPLELGGAPFDPLNLWPEPRLGPHPAAEKDSAENYLHRQVCSGHLLLEYAQDEMARNWEQVHPQ